MRPFDSLGSSFLTQTDLTLPVWPEKLVRSVSPTTSHRHSRWSPEAVTWYQCLGGGATVSHWQQVHIEWLTSCVPPGNQAISNTAFLWASNSETKRWIHLVRVIGNSHTKFSYQTCEMVTRVSFRHKWVKMWVPVLNKGGGWQVQVVIYLLQTGDKLYLPTSTKRPPGLTAMQSWPHNSGCTRLEPLSLFLLRNGTGAAVLRVVPVRQESHAPTRMQTS